jgi:hypothetical protein
VPLGHAGSVYAPPRSELRELIEQGVYPLGTLLDVTNPWHVGTLLYEVKLPDELVPEYVVEDG